VVVVGVWRERAAERQTPIRANRGLGLIIVVCGHRDDSERATEASEQRRVVMPEFLDSAARQYQWLGGACSAASRGSRGRRGLALPGLLLLAAALLATPADADGGRDRSNIGRAIKKVQERPRYAHADWGLMVADLRTGRTILQQEPETLFRIASASKLFAMAGAFVQFGSDHRFETPILRDGEVDSSGVLDGDLILVASGDLTMGGRRNPDGTIAYTDFDHNDANAVGGAILTKPDPLAGLDDLAEQVAAAGITTVQGDVVIDDRLFETTPHREYILTPIIINDNLIDLTIEPQSAGALAPVAWRPKSAAFEVVSEVTTVEAGGPTDIEISADSSGGLTTILVSGTVAADADDNPFGLQEVRTYQVEDPASFARTLLIEALQRAGVSVAASALGENPRGRLPASDAIGALPQVAVLTSDPYSQQAKLILKVSHNLGADTASMLLASANGERSRLEGMAILGGIIEMLGIDGRRYAAFDASGLATYATPKALVQLLRAMALQSDAEAYLDALPIMGVDGSLAFVQQDSPAAGHVFAKTGTGAQLDAAHDKVFLTEKALAGYIDSKRGQRLVFAIMVEGVPLDSVLASIEVNDDLGEIAAIAWSGRR
jgi:D-alanyl-D-alanine carboxypeptidase/D-alanyl-D-alanine-endopeptidase (penicillin-binding protein 4)